MREGLKKGETFLGKRMVEEVPLAIAKLRLKVYKAHARYLIGVIDDREYLPFVIDLKKGKHGKNLSFNTDKKTQQFIINALIKGVADYKAHARNDPRMEIYFIDI